MAVEGELVPSSLLPTQPSPGAEIAGPPAATPNPKTVLAAAEDCRQLVATHRAQEAVVCYQRQSMRNGLAGETAAYELARLWRDTLGQPDRALATFESQRSRFPAGALRREADLSVIEILPRLGRHAEALVESQRFLAAYPGDERKGELYLLRGNIYREALRDLAHAQLEYALGAGAKGRAGDDSQFFQAVCLEALGRLEEARRAYQTYLRQRGAVHAAEAKNRLAGLAP
jgi:tetratricopeptide (TPR) repeat protein